MPTMRRADVSCSTTPAARQATLHTLFLPTNREVDAALWSDAPANAERWAHLRSWRRYLPDGTVFVVLRSGLGLVVGVNTVYAIAVCAYFTWLVPLGAPDWPDDVSRAAVAPIAALNLVSFALALLLVFRIQTVGARWWEARTAWGSIFNACRNLARLLALWMPRDDEGGDRPCTAAARRWSQALPAIARHHLRRHPEGIIRPELRPFLLAHEVDWLLGPGVNHMPTAAAAVIEAAARGASTTLSPGASHTLRPGAAHTLSPDLCASTALSAQVCASIADQLSLYVNSVGVCERIKTTSVPMAINRHTARFLQLWFCLLPAVVWPAVHWAAPVLQALLAFSLYGIENVGAQLEEPVQRLPQAAYAAALADDVRQAWETAADARDIAAGGKPAGRVVEPRTHDAKDIVAGGKPVGAGG